MKYPLSMSVSVVQLNELDPPDVVVTYESAETPLRRMRVSFKLDLVQDATDMQMWAQMIAARVCDAL